MTIKSKNKQVQNFLDEIEEFGTDKFVTLQELRKIVFKVFPKAKEEIKYGGIVFLLDEHLFSGIFVRKNHISLEFVFGSKMNDPKKFL